MTASIVTRDMASQLAHVAIDAETIGPPEPPAHIALPGALQAISREHLHAYQDAGHDQHAIVARVNARYQQANAKRLAEHNRWVAGPYADAIEEMSRQAAERAAEDMRRRAIFEELIAERDAESGD